MKKTTTLVVLVTMLFALILAATPKTANAGLFNIPISEESTSTDDGSVKIGGDASLINSQSEKWLLSYGDLMGRVSPIPKGCSLYTLRIKLRSDGGVQFDSEGQKKAMATGSWSQYMPYAKLSQLPDGSWEILIPLGDRVFGPLFFSAQVTSVTGKKKSRLKLFKILPIPFTGSTKDITKVMSVGMVFQGLSYTSDRYTSTEAINLWVVDVIDLITKRFNGIITGIDLYNGNLPNDARVEAFETGKIKHIFDPLPLPQTLVPVAPKVVKYFDVIAAGDKLAVEVLETYTNENGENEINFIRHYIDGRRPVSCLIHTMKGDMSYFNPKGLSSVEVNGKTFIISVQQTQQ